MARRHPHSPIHIPAFALTAIFVAACGGSGQTVSPTTSGGTSGNANAGGSGGTVSATAGTATSTGGLSGGSGLVSESSGGTSPRTSSLSTAGSSTAPPINCNPNAVTCDMATPACPNGQVPVVNAGGTCYTGECAAIGACGCTTPSECPNSNIYTCYNASRHCGPYLN